MSKIDQTYGEVSDSLTGFDEIAITQRFGRPVTDLFNDDFSMWMRALVFVLKRRDGLNDEEAWNAALGMALGAVSEYFADASAESGKDETETEPQPESSPPSAS